MKYVFDTNAFVVLFNFYPSRFPSLWDLFDELVDEGNVVSVREVYREIISYGGDSRLVRWANDHRNLLKEPTEDEISYIKQILAIPRFQQVVEKKKIYEGKPVADPFIITKAKTVNGVVVTLEKYKEDAAKIPNVCERFGIDCIDLEGFMEREDWIF